jgi:hypothetical protein
MDWKSWPRRQRARASAPAHHGLALLTHYGQNVGKIEINQTLLDNKIADAGHARIEHLIGQAEGIGGRLLVGQPEQILVWDDQQGVHDLQQFRDAVSAKRMRRWPSKWNGLVTTPMVRMPS